MRYKQALRLLASDWGIHESTAWRIVPRIENALIKAEEFRLPSKRQLQQSEAEIEIVVIDVAETEIERPKKADAIALRKPQRALHQATKSLL